MKILIQNQAKEYLLKIEKGMTPDPNTAGWYQDENWISFKGDLEINEFESEEQAMKFALK